MAEEGAWRDPPAPATVAWGALRARYEAIVARHPRIDRGPHVQHLGTLATGNHFIELCLDQEDRVWSMLHSGSRGVGNRVGSYFIELAKQDMRRWFVNLPDQDLAYFPEGTQHFDEYIEAVTWAQDYAAANRELMMKAIVAAVRGSGEAPAFEATLEAVHCHHDYVARENHFGKNVLVTRKGAGGRPRDHPGEHGRAVVHHPGEGERRELPLVQPRRGRRRSGGSRSRTTRPRPRGSSAGRTRT